MREQLPDAVRTAGAVAAWIAFDAVIPSQSNRMVSLLLGILQIIVAVAIAHLVGLAIPQRPRIVLRAEYLSEPNHPHGEPILGSPFRVVVDPVRHTFWLRLSLAYECEGLIARYISKGLPTSNSTVEIELSPPAGMLCNLESVNGVEASQLVGGRRGASVALPNPLPKGQFGVFQLEVRPQLNPKPLPVTSTVRLEHSPSAMRRTRAVRVVTQLGNFDVAAN